MGVTLFYLTNLECGFNKFLSQVSLNPLLVDAHTCCTHMILHEEVHLFQKSLLAVRVGGQQVCDERECVSDDLMASDEEDEGLAHNFIRG